MPLQLTYALSALPNPLTLGTTAGMLTLMATNNSTQPVYIQGISLSIPVGTNDNDLTGNTAQINCTTPPGWNEKGKAETGTYTFVFTPATEPYTVPAGSSLVFVLGNISVNDQQGTAELTITEGSDGNPTEIKHVSKFPQDWGAVNFTATLPDPPNPGNAILSWQGPEGATYTIQYFDYDTREEVTIPAAGGAQLASTGVYPGESDPPLAVDHTTLFTLSVKEVIDGRLYETEAQQTLEVYVPPPSPVITSFTPSFSGTGINRALDLTWTTTNADHVEASWTLPNLPANPTMPAASGAPFTYSYSITAVGSGGRSAPETISLQWKGLGNISVVDVPTTAVFTTDGKYAFVSCFNATTFVGLVHVIDLTVLSVTKTLDINNIACFGVVPNGQYILGLNQNDQNVAVITLPEIEVQTNIGGLGSEADGIAVTPGSQYAFVPNLPDNNVSVFDLNTMQNINTIGVGEQPGSIAVTPDGRYAVVSNYQSGDVSFINILTQEVTYTVNTAAGVFGTAITPDSTQALVINDKDNTLKLISIAGMQVAQTIALGKQPYMVSVTPDGNYALVVCEAMISCIHIHQPGARPVNINMPQILQTSDSYQALLVITPDSKYAFAANSNDTVSMIDLQTLAVVQEIPVGKSPYSLAISPDGQYILVSNAQDGTVSLLGLSF